MIIDFMQIQKLKFDELAQKIMAEPQRFIDFESVSDFYKADWLEALPKGTTWAVSGLDNGSDDFYIYLEFKDRFLSIEVNDKINVKYGVKA